MTELTQEELDARAAKLKEEFTPCFIVHRDRHGFRFLVEYFDDSGKSRYGLAYNSETLEHPITQTLIGICKARDEMVAKWSMAGGADPATSDLFCFDGGDGLGFGSVHDANVGGRLAGVEQDAQKAGAE